MFIDYSPWPCSVVTVASDSVVQFVRKSDCPPLRYDAGATASPYNIKITTLHMNRYRYNVAGLIEEECYVYDDVERTIYRHRRPEDETHKLNPYELSMHIMGLRNELARVHERDREWHVDGVGGEQRMRDMRVKHRREQLHLQDRIDRIYINHRAYNVKTVCTNRVDKGPRRTYHVGCESDVQPLPGPF